PPGDGRTWVIRMTSGTTNGEPLVIMQTLPADPPASWFGGAMRVALCYGSLNARLNNILLYRKMSGDSPQRILPMDGREVSVSRKAQTTLLAEFRPEMMIGAPSFVLRLAAGLDSQARSGVKALRLAGELLTSQKMRTLAESFPNAEIVSMYIATEIGPITRPSCAHLPPNHYHPRKTIRIEIDEPDDSGFGDILVSTRVGGAIAIRGYRVGDVGRLYEVACPCGATEALEVQGRKGFDYLKLEGALLRREEFDRVALLFPNVIDDYRAAVSEVVVDSVPKGQVHLRMYRSRGPGTEDLAREIGRRFSQELFVTPTKTLADLVARGIFLPLEAEFVKEPFPEKNKEVKLSRL
ncbi:MAG: hypothetical protein RLZZ416_656, partial [Candidatus Parcubacteria bacterium]